MGLLEEWFHFFKTHASCSDQMRVVAPFLKSTRRALAL